LLLAMANGNLWPRTDLTLGFLNDPPAFASVGIGLPVFALYLIIYARRFERNLAAVIDNNIVSGSSKDIRRKITAIVKRYNSKWFYVLLGAPLFNFIWLCYWYTHPDSTAWFFQPPPNSRTLNLSGWYYCLIISMLVYVCLSTICYGVLTIMLSRSISRIGKIRIRPLHIDGSGGLAPIGALALLNVWFIAFGSFIVVATIYSNTHYTQSALITPLHLAIFGFYFLVAFFIFFLPLWFFHKPMKHERTETLLVLERRFNTIYDGLHCKAHEDSPSCLEHITAIKEAYDIVNHMPVWPFNYGLVMRFLLSVLLPVWASLAGEIVKWILRLAWPL